MGEDPDQTPAGRRLTVSDAALELGLSAEAVRSRVKRGTLPSVKEGSTVYVLLPPDRTRPYHDQTTTEHDRTSARSRSDADALISAKDETIAALREQLEAERQAHAEARRLLMAALERIPPAIEAPREAPGGPQTAAGASDRSEPRPATGGAQEGSERPWWRRLFGG
ncbi:MAG: hypothetical protein M3N33_02020 [Actinomycetota bacterium]|nr:hypothetical protein [Actinomycetota bacterium]